jgi:hypothetical protein
MPRLYEYFMFEMPRRKGDPILATLDWAAQQRGTFTINDLYNVYVANGGRANSMGDNKQSFSTQINRYIAKPWKEDQDKYGVSEKRPLLAVRRGARGGGGRNPTILQWGLDRPLRDPSAAHFVEPDDDSSTGDAMDRLEKVLSRMGKGLPDDPKQGRQRLKAAIERWKKMKTLNQVVADIRGTIPKAGQMDALHIASEFLIDRGAADEDDVEDAEDQVAPAPPAVSSHDDDDDVGEFSDEPEDLDTIPDEEYDEEESEATSDDEYDEEEPEATSDDEYDEEEPPSPPVKRTIAPPSFSKPVTPSAGPGVTVRKKEEPPAATARPEPEDDDEEDIEEPTKRQAGAANFIRPQATPAAPKSPLTKFFRRGR